MSEGDPPAPRRLAGPSCGTRAAREPARPRDCLSRRDLLERGAALLPVAGLVAGCRAETGASGGEDPAAAPAGGAPAIGGRAMQAVVAGAGAFGGWTALHLLRRGVAVTLIDGWGPGNSRASSGGETRVIRHTYEDRVYVDWVARSLRQWRDGQQRWGRRLLHETGMLSMVQGEAAYDGIGVEHLRDAGIRHRELSADDLRSAYPQIATAGIRWAVLEEEAGYLLARRACEAVVEAFLAEGGRYLQTLVETVDAGGDRPTVYLLDGEQLRPDQLVMALGPWLGQTFPAVVGDRVTPTRQEVFYFGTPRTDTSFEEGQLPIWVDHGERIWYGIPGNERRGFKVADDTRGPRFDPTHADRQPTPEVLERARAFMERRFPGMGGAPLLESRVCQYENSPDGHFIIDRHPESERLWLVGGGSGHGFKHGPALGEHVAALVLGRQDPDPFFGLARFAG